MLLYLSLLIGLGVCQDITTPATSSFPFDDIKDPSKQCVDIFCYEPIEWSDNKRPVCRYRKQRECTPRTKEICRNVPITTCEIFGYTECEDIPNPQNVRDDRVVGEYFYEQSCDHNPINVTELKMKPDCVPMTKNVCEKMWVEEAPYWKDVNCKEKTWQNCTLVPDLHTTTIDYCNCTPTEIWYNKFEEKNVDCPALDTTCTPNAVIMCDTIEERKCITVEWEECKETCIEECNEQHFKEPSQEADHRRWCSHVEIKLPDGVSGPPPAVIPPPPVPRSNV